ncbi:hypothetical protein OWM54_09525 [Myxococcus sp. MISCRS1]|uniref:hypothetical protein n=1 Tax=Myxococcus TaxID=32 RepID=UPI00129C1B15|nr:MULTISPECIES: hypothetical protein [Myxococcus]MCK8504176.1 hypothetical protein [Myxococcus fulvus]MCY0997373.1 hypothetical protein [Myxococcus sp. MISCRS1]
MKQLAGVLSVLAVVALFMKGFDSNGVVSTAEAAAASKATTTVTKTSTTKATTKTVTTVKTATKTVAPK